MLRVDRQGRGCALAGDTDEAGVSDARAGGSRRRHPSTTSATHVASAASKELSLPALSLKPSIK